MKSRKQYLILLLFCAGLIFNTVNLDVVKGDSQSFESVSVETQLEKADPHDLPILEDTAGGMDIVAKHQSLIAGGAVESRSARSENGLSYELANGRKAVLLSSAPITYQDRTGQHQIIDNSLITDTSEVGYQYKNKAHAFSVFFPEQADRQSDILIRSQAGHEIHLWQQGEMWVEDTSGAGQKILSAAASTGVIEENTITFPNRYPGISEIFNVRHAGIKHSFEIEKLPEFLSDHQDGVLVFQETLVLPKGTQVLVDGKPQTETFITGKKIVFRDSAGAFIGEIPVPWAHENTSESYDPESDASLFLTHRVQNVDENVVLISVRVPVAWLKEAERHFPVTIDPSLNFYTNAGTDDGYQWGSTLISHMNDFLKVGYDSSYGFPYYFTHMTFHDVNIPKGSTIDVVTLSYRVYQDATNTCSFAYLWEDSDNSQPIAIYPPYVADREYDGSFVYDTSYSTPWSAGEWRSTVLTNFTVNRPGWTSGNNVSLAWKPYDASGGYRYIYSYDGGSAPYLYVEYTPDIEDPQVTLTSPTGGENWQIGTTHNITWTATDNGIVDHVDLFYSTDGGEAYYTLATDEPNDGSYPWLIPDTPSTTAVVKVIAYDAAGNEGWRSNDYVFTISPPDDNYEENDTLETSYIIKNDEQTWLSDINGYGILLDQDWYEIYVNSGYERVLIDAQFTHSEGNVDIGLYDSNGIHLDTSVSSTDDEFIDFTVPAGDAYYYILVDGANAGNQYDLWWDDVFRDDNYEENDTRAAAYDLSSHEQTWLSNIDGYGIQADDDWYRIYVDGGFERVQIIAGFTHSEGDIDMALYSSSGEMLDISNSATDDEYIDFTVPASDAYYFIKIYHANAGNQYDLRWDDVEPNDDEDPVVTVTSPNGGETWQAGTKQTVLWTATDNVGVDGIWLSYSVDGGSSWIYLSPVEINDGSYTWTVPDNPTLNAKFRVYAFDAAGNEGFDISDHIFTIAPVGFENFIPILTHNANP